MENRKNILSAIATIFIEHENSINKGSQEKYTKIMKMIIEKQNELNVKLAKNENYAIELRTDVGKFINFGNCLMSEAMELQDSTPWKHWKAGRYNKENVNTEIVDNFHFFSSIMIVLSLAQEGLAAEADPSEVGSIMDVIKLADLLGQQEDLEKAKIILTNVIKNHLMGLAVKLSSIFTEIEIFQEYGISKNEDKLPLEQMLFYCAIYASLNLILWMINNESDDINKAMEDIYAAYIVKNVLNGFRDDNGYKEGTYVKIWEITEDSICREDNDLAFEFIRNNDIAPEDLIARLTEFLNEKYAHVVKKNIDS